MLTRLKNHFSYDMKELKNIVITVFVLSFILSFRAWGVDSFDAYQGLQNLVIAIILTGFSYAIKLGIQKYAALHEGYDIQFNVWWVGLVVGIALAFLTNGVLVFLALGAVSYSVIEHMRIGHKYKLDYDAMAKIALLGPLSHIALAALFKIALNVPAFNQEVLLLGMKMNLLFAFFAILPIPNINTPKDINASDGLMLFYASRWAYVTSLGLIIGSIAALMAIESTLLALVIAGIFSIVVAACYYLITNKK